MNYIRFRAMGTDVEAWTDQDHNGTALRDWFESVEAECSRFRDDSALSAVNDSGNEVAFVDGILAEVFEAAQNVKQQTTGLVDVGLGAAVVNWGYDHSFDGDMDLASVPKRTSTSEWSYSDGVLCKGRDTRFDLGGVAKGWTCDRAVELGLARVVSAGGDIRSNHEKTSVPLLDPWGVEATVIDLGIGALATSSQTKRRWKVADREVNHIIDPRSMAPCDSPTLSASVVAATALEAEAGAKAVLLLGEGGLRWAAENEWVESAAIVWHDGSVFGTHGLRVAV